MATVLPEVAGPQGMTASTQVIPALSSVLVLQRAPVSRLVHKSDFEALLGSPARKRSAHFVIHHLDGSAATPAQPPRRAKAAKLSTGGAQLVPPAVDDLSTAEAETDVQTRPAVALKHQSGEQAAPQNTAAASPGAALGPRWWLGCVVPKRHAKRAVTRTLLKRQMRQAFESQAGGLPEGRWLMRLNRGFANTQFRSAASDALRRAASEELHKLLLNLSSAAAPAVRWRPMTDTVVASSVGLQAGSRAISHAGSQAGSQAGSTCRP